MLQFLLSIVVSSSMRKLWFPMQHVHLPLFLLSLPLTTWSAGNDGDISGFRRYEQQLGILSSAPTSTTHAPMQRLSGTKLISYTDADDDVGPFSQSSDKGCPAHSERHHRTMSLPGASGLTQQYSAVCVCVKGYRAHAVAAATVNGDSTVPRACLPAFLYSMKGMVQLQGELLSRRTLDMWAEHDLKEHSAPALAGSTHNASRYTSRALLQLRKAVAAGMRNAIAAVILASGAKKAGAAHRSDDAAVLRILDTDVLLTGAAQPSSPQASTAIIASQTPLFRASGSQTLPTAQTQALTLQFELRLFSPKPPASGIAITLTDAVQTPQFPLTLLSMLQRAPGAWQDAQVRAARVSATAVQATQWQSLPPANCALTPWGRWGRCSVSCVSAGAGVGSHGSTEEWQTRVRVVLHGAALGGKRCPPRAQQQQRRQCVPAAPRCPTPAPLPSPTPFPTPTGPVNCLFSDWGAWEACSATCAASSGSGGLDGGVPVRVRSRSVLQRALRGGMACPALRQHTSCHVSLCPVDCAVAHWGAWEACNAGCGHGTRRRTRHVRARPQFGGRECPVLVHERACAGLRPCAIDCEISRWGAWRDCDRTCGRGEQRRDRIIVRRAANGGKSCTPMLHQSRRCGTVPCPLNCRFSDWASWGPCTVSCSASGAAGQGVRQRRRHVLVAAGHGGVPCPALLERGRCGRACPIDCKLASAWGKWSPCSRSCGGGRRISSRAVLRAAAYGGKHCMGRTRAERCARTACSADCMVSTTTWESCSHTCGSKGTQKGTRSVLLPAGRGGKPCPKLSLMRPCGRLPCPVSCKLSKWGAWNECDYSCPNGVAAGTYIPQYQKRLRTVLRAAVGGGQSCADAAMAANEAHLLIQQRILGDPFAPPVVNNSRNATAATAHDAPDWWLYEQRACEARQPCGSVRCGHGQAEAFSLGGGAEHLRCEFDGRHGEVRAIKRGLVAKHIAFKCTQLSGQSREGLMGCNCFCWARGAVGGDAKERVFEFTESGAVRRPTPAPSTAPSPSPKQPSPGESDGGVATLVRDPSPRTSGAAANFLRAEWASVHHHDSRRRAQNPRLRSRGAGAGAGGHSHSPGRIGSATASGGGSVAHTTHHTTRQQGSSLSSKSVPSAVPAFSKWDVPNERQQRQERGDSDDAGRINYALGILILLLAAKIAHQRELGVQATQYEATEGIELHDGAGYTQSNVSSWNATAQASHARTFGSYGASAAATNASDAGNVECDENIVYRAANQL